MKYFILFFSALAANCFSQAISSSACEVQVRIFDENGLETAARVRISSQGKSINQPPNHALSVMYGLWDHADGFWFQPDSSIYVNKNFSIRLPKKRHTLFVSKGFEYNDVEVDFDCKRDTTITVRLKRWVNMQHRHWYSADDHIHIRRSPNEDSTLLEWIKAENLNVGVFLRMGDFWSTYYEQYGWGNEAAYQRDKHMLVSGQEDPRTPQLGHTLGIAPDSKSRFEREYFLYDKVFDDIHRHNGITGYAHQAELFHGYRGLTLDGLRNKVDEIELLQFCTAEDPMQTRHYYHMLNLGFKLTAIAGSDFPWCGRDHDHGRPERNARIGDARFYTYVAGKFTFESWRQALKKGNTFATTGPMLLFHVDNAIAGDSMNVKKNAKVKVKISAFGNRKVAVNRIELIQNGKVIASRLLKPGDKADSLSMETNVMITNGCWLAARCFGADGMAAHTTPVYVYVGEEGFYDRATLNENIELAEKYLDEIKSEVAEKSDKPEKQAWRFKDELQRRVEKAEQVLKMLRARQR